jgi:hypothetical protein
MNALCYRGGLRWVNTFNVEIDLLGWMHPTGPDDALPDSYRSANDNQYTAWFCLCGNSHFELLPDRIRCTSCRQTVTSWP